jgi:hypothetical protein
VGLQVDSDDLEDADDGAISGDDDEDAPTEQVEWSRRCKGREEFLSPAVRYELTMALVGHSARLIDARSIKLERGVTVGGQRRTCFLWGEPCAPRSSVQRTYTSAHTVVDYDKLTLTAQAIVGPSAHRDELVATVECFYLCTLGGSTLLCARIRLFGPLALARDPKTKLTVITNRSVYTVCHVAARDLGEVVALAPGAPGMDPASPHHWSVLRHLSKFTGYKG